MGKGKSRRETETDVGGPGVTHGRCEEEEEVQKEAEKKRGNR